MDPAKTSLALTPTKKDPGVSKKKRRRRLKVKPNLVPRKMQATEAAALSKASGAGVEPEPSTSTLTQASLPRDKSYIEETDEKQRVEPGYESSFSFESEGSEPKFEGTGNQFKELATNSDEDDQRLEALIDEIRSRRQARKEQSRPTQQKETYQESSKKVEQQQQQRTKTQQQQQKGQQQQQQQQKKQRVPPINIFHQPTDDTIRLGRLVLKNQFSIKRFSGNKHALICSTLEGYNKIKPLLEKAQTQFYSYTAKTEKVQSILLKGMDPETDPEDLLSELKGHESDTLKFLAVKRFSTAASRTNQRPLPIFLVQLSPMSKLDNLKTIKYLNYHVVSWEKLNKRDNVLQCMRCQRFGHAAANCNMEFRCVKCEKNHKPGECPLGKERVEDRSKLFCVLCRNYGHPANYRGCPKYEELKKKIKARKQQVEEERRQKGRMFQNFVAPNVSFAQMASGQGQTTKEQTQKTNAAPSGADMELKAVLLSIQGQIAQLQRQLNEQATRIDIIYSTLFSEPNAP